MKRWVIPATCTSWSPKLEISGVGLKPYFSAGITSATSRISVAARWKVAASSLARLGAGVWAESNEGTAAATTAKNTTHAWARVFMVASRRDSSHSVHAWSSDRATRHAWVVTRTSGGRALRSAAR